MVKRCSIEPRYEFDQILWKELHHINIFPPFQVFFLTWHVALTIYSFAISHREKEEKKREETTDKVILFGMVTYYLGSLALTIAMITFIVQADNL